MDGEPGPIPSGSPQEPQALEPQPQPQPQAQPQAQRARGAPCNPLFFCPLTGHQLQGDRLRVQAMCGCGQREVRVDEIVDLRRTEGRCAWAGEMGSFVLYVRDGANIRSIVLRTRRHVDQEFNALLAALSNPSLPPPASMLAFPYPRRLSLPSSSARPPRPSPSRHQQSAPALPTTHRFAGKPVRPDLPFVLYDPRGDHCTAKCARIVAPCRCLAFDDTLITQSKVITRSRGPCAPCVSRPPAVFDLSRVRHVSVEQSTCQQLVFGTGTLYLSGVGVQARGSRIPHVAHAAQVQALVSEVVNTQHTVRPGLELMRR